MRDVQRIFYEQMKELYVVLESFLGDRRKIKTTQSFHSHYRYDTYLKSKERAKQFKKLIVMVCGSGKTYLAYLIFKYIYRTKTNGKNLFVM